MHLLVHNHHSFGYSKLLCGSGSRACRAGAERRRVGCSTPDRSCAQSKLLEVPGVSPANSAGLCLAIIAGILSPVLPALAQDVTPTPQTTGQPLVIAAEVIVTGSNIPTAEEVGPLPVDTYRREDITRLGVRSATDFIQKLPVATGGSINENITSNGDGRVEVNLRGILPKETLVLQDGRRLAPVGFAGDTVDLNMFPFGLIDHIDILKDGASAIYGSDAVDGVFNVWLIHRFRGLEVYASYGNTNLGFANDMGEERAYLLAGTGDDKTDIVLYGEVYNRAAIYSRDADISHDADQRPFGGLDLRSSNYAGGVGRTFIGRPLFVYQPRLNDGARSPTPHAFPNVESDPQYVPLSSLPREQQLFNLFDFTPAMAPVDREYLYGSLDTKLCQQYLELFADFKYVRTFWDGAQAPVPFTPDVFTDVNHPLGVPGISPSGISVPIQNPFNPFTVPDYVSPGGFDPNRPDTQSSAAPPGTGFTTNVHYRSLEAGLRTDKITTNNYLFTGGLKGNLGEFGDYFKTWKWESGFRYNEDDRIERFGPIVDNNALRAALLDTDPATAFNPFGLNQNSRAVIDKVFVTIHQRLGTTSLILEDLKLYGDLWNLPTGPISFAIGAEHRTEHATNQPDALLVSGQTTGATTFVVTHPGGGSGPIKGSRDVWSIYWEVRVPVTSPVWNCPGLYSLELGYQERYENFSDFGATERPKLFFRWQPIDSSLTLRATYNEGFHAPTLAELFTPQAQVRGTVLDQAGLTPDPEINETIGGNPDLQPEHAYEWTYGAVWTPKFIKGLTLSADWYHIDLRNMTGILNPEFIVDTNFFTATIFAPNGAPLNGKFQNLITRDPVTGAILNVTGTEQNIARTITEGLDYEAMYQLDSSIFGRGDFGTFTFTLNGNYLSRYRSQANPAVPRIDLTGQFLGTTTGGALPHNRWYASVFYDWGGLDAGGTIHFVGQTSDLPFAAANFGNRKIREWTTLDLIVNYTFNFPQPVTEQVAGYAKDGGKNVKMKDRKDKYVAPVTTASYSECGWRAWLNNTTITLGMNNVFDQPPPFVAGAIENGYDEATANIKGRTWYLALTKRF